MGYKYPIFWRSLSIHRISCGTSSSYGFLVIMDGYKKKPTRVTVTQLYIECIYSETCLKRTSFGPAFVFGIDMFRLNRLN